MSRFMMILATLGLLTLTANTAWAQYGHGHHHSPHAGWGGHYGGGYWGHGRLHDELDHNAYHRDLGHRQAHRYPMSWRQHEQLHDDLDHDAYHDALRHRQYHRTYRPPIGRSYFGVGGRGFSIWFGY